MSAELQDNGPPPIGEFEVQKNWTDLYPTPEDWVALQGGKPRVFHNPDKPDTRWVVMHIYDEHPDAKNRFRNGAIIPTLPVKAGYPLSRFTVNRIDFEGNEMERDIRVPSFMVSSLHGIPCEERSVAAGAQVGGYVRVSNQEDYERVIKEMRYKGMQEMRFGLSRTGYKLEPLPQIRPPKTHEEL